MRAASQGRPREGGGSVGGWAISTFRGLLAVVGGRLWRTSGELLPRGGLTEGETPPSVEGDPPPAELLAEKGQSAAAGMKMEASGHASLLAGEQRRGAHWVTGRVL